VISPAWPRTVPEEIADKEKSARPSTRVWSVVIEVLDIERALTAGDLYRGHTVMDVYRVTKGSTVVGEFRGRSIGSTVFQAPSSTPNQAAIFCGTSSAARPGMHRAAFRRIAACLTARSEYGHRECETPRQDGPRR
jgi:hypothetical protein